MTSRTTLTVKAGIACLRMLAAVSVYCFARLYYPVLLQPFQATQATLAAHTNLSGSAPSLPGSSWQLVGPYWTRDAFDQIDLVATVLGGAIALATLTCLPMEHNDESN